MVQSRSVASSFDLQQAIENRCVRGTFRSLRPEAKEVAPVAYIRGRVSTVARKQRASIVIGHARRTEALANVT